MYSGDFRSRVSTYDRMRADQDRISNLLSKSRETKKKLKTGELNAKQSTKRSLSPQRPQRSAEYSVDSNADIEHALTLKKQKLDPALFAYVVLFYFILCVYLMYIMKSTFCVVKIKYNEKLAGASTRCCIIIF